MNQKGVRDISPTLQEAQNKNVPQFDLILCSDLIIYNKKCVHTWITVYLSNTILTWDVGSHGLMVGESDS